VRLRQNKQLPVFTPADDNMSSNEKCIQISETDTETFIQSMNNDNTWKKTKSDVKLFSEWLHKENADRLIEDIEKDQLDQYLARFFLSVRNGKGEEYEPDTLKSFQASVSRYLMEKTKTNIMLDRDTQEMSCRPK
jgi:site-specific recombinase XerD